MFFNFDDFSSGRQRVDWNSIINQGFAVGSQAIQAWGKRPSTQFAQGGNGIFAIQASNQPMGYEGGYGYGGMTAAQAAALAAQNRNGGALEDASGSFMYYVKKHPDVVAAIAIGAFLLFREPPRRR